MTCPICGKPTAGAARPFCSRRCADLDLAKWLGGQYRVPTEEPDDGSAGGLPDDAEERFGSGRWPH